MKSDKPESPFAPARATLQATISRLEGFHRTPITPPAGKVVGDLMITTSEEELITAIEECRSPGMPEKVGIILDYITQLLRDGELKFKNSATHAVKITK